MVDVWFDSKSGSRGVFNLTGVKPGKDKKSGALFMDLRMSAVREETDVVLGRDLKFAEDRAHLVASGGMPSTIIATSPNEDGKVELREVKDGHGLELLMAVPATIRTMKLSLKKGGPRLDAVLRIPLDAASCGIANHFGSDLHVTWSPAQQGLAFVGTPPGESSKGEDMGNDADAESDGSVPIRGRRKGKG